LRPTQETRDQSVWDLAGNNVRYDDLYGKNDSYFGSEPSRLLREKHGLLDRTGPVLDVGVGQGRNALFLARKGFSVDAIDTSLVSIETVRSLAEREDLPIKTFHAGFARFCAEDRKYSGVLVLGLIQILSWEEISLLDQKADEWTGAGGLLFITAFTTHDPSFAVSMNRLEKIGRNSFADEQGNVRTYLEPGEVLGIFGGFTPLHHWEGLGREHRHPDTPPERHGMAEVVMRKM